MHILKDLQQHVSRRSDRARAQGNGGCPAGPNKRERGVEYLHIVYHPCTFCQYEFKPFKSKRLEEWEGRKPKTSGGLLEGALDEGEAAFSLFAEHFFFVGEFRLEVVKLVSDGQGRKNR